MINTITQIFGSPGLYSQVQEFIKSCDECQHFKTKNKQAYGKLPLNPPQHSKMPWEKVQLDCCGPWTIRYKDGANTKVVKFEIRLLSMVDVGSSWSEFARIAT